MTSDEIYCPYGFENNGQDCCGGYCDMGSNGKPAKGKPQPISTAPRDGTRILAWWPACDSDLCTWTTTWWSVTAGGIGQWECVWAYADESDAPTHWLPDPGAPE
jgi:hypothetical protein